MKVIVGKVVKVQSHAKVIKAAALPRRKRVHQTTIGATTLMMMSFL